jgi:hypothetical protein
MAAACSAGIALAVTLASRAAAQDAAPQFTPEKLQELVSPIALYPDPLLAQTLTASTFPDQVVEANTWAQQNSELNGEELGEAIGAAGFTWDASVQALVPFPDVLSELVEDPDWMRDLGNAVLAQRGDVMNAIQTMRHKAADAGNLKSSEQMKVTTTPKQSDVTIDDIGTVVSPSETAPSSGGTTTTASTQTTIIEIQPANPEVIYVPTYPPAVYAPPPPSGAGVMMGFMTGVMIAEAFDDDFYGGCGFGWHNNTVVINNNNFNRTWNNRNSYRPSTRGPQPRRRSGAQAGTRPAQGGPGGRDVNRPNQGGPGGRDAANRPSQGGAGGRDANRPSQGDVQNRPGQGGAGTRDAQTRPSAGTRERTSPGAGSRGYSRPQQGGGAMGGMQGGRREGNMGSRGRASGGARGGGGRRR